MDETAANDTPGLIGWSKSRSGVVVYSADNLTREQRLAGYIELAQSSAARRRGLLGVAELSAEHGLWLNPCEAIHTFGMKIPLDAVFIDISFAVRKIVINLVPWRIALCLSAQSVLELPAGTVSRTGTQVGDKLQLQRLV